MLARPASTSSNALRPRPPPKSAIDFRANRVDLTGRSGNPPPEIAGTQDRAGKRRARLFSMPSNVLRTPATPDSTIEFRADRADFIGRSREPPPEGAKTQDRAGGRRPRPSSTSTNTPSTPATPKHDFEIRAKRDVLRGSTLAKRLRTRRKLGGAWREGRASLECRLHRGRCARTCGIGDFRWRWAPGDEDAASCPALGDVSQTL